MAFLPRDSTRPAGMELCAREDVKATEILWLCVRSPQPLPPDQAAARIGMISQPDVVLGTEGEIDRYDGRAKRGCVGRQHSDACAGHDGEIVRSAAVRPDANPIYLAARLFDVFFHR